MATVPIIKERARTGAPDGWLVDIDWSSTWKDKREVRAEDVVLPPSVPIIGMRPAAIFVAIQVENVNPELRTAYCVAKMSPPFVDSGALLKFQQEHGPVFWRALDQLFSCSAPDLGSQLEMVYWVAKPDPHDPGAMPDMLVVSLDWQAGQRARHAAEQRRRLGLREAAARGGVQPWQGEEWPYVGWLIRGVRELFHPPIPFDIERLPHLVEVIPGDEDPWQDLHEEISRMLNAKLLQVMSSLFRLHFVNDHANRKGLEKAGLGAMAGLQTMIPQGRLVDSRSFLGGGRRSVLFARERGVKIDPTDAPAPKNLR